jgi:hypothetical protein
VTPDPDRLGFDVRRKTPIPVPDIAVGKVILIWPLDGRDPVRAKVADKPNWDRKKGLPVIEWRSDVGDFQRPNVYYACYAIDALRMCGECEKEGCFDDDYLCEECRQAYVH